MADLAGYIEYLRGDKATRYSDPTNAAIQAERLKVADDLERMLDATAAPVVVGEDRTMALAGELFKNGFGSSLENAKAIAAFVTSKTAALAGDQGSQAE